MGKYLAGQKSKTLADLLGKKAKGERISMVTCYDGAFARLMDLSNIDAVLVGDSLGNVILEHSLISVTLLFLLS